MSPDSPGDDAPRVYKVRMSEPAEAELGSAYLNLLRSASLSFADRWREGLLVALDGLALFPQSHSIAPEAAGFRIPVRRLVYRQGRVVHRVLFHLMDEDEDGQDDTVNILHLRHGAQEPLGETVEDDD